MGFIYRVTNQINGKVYIGKTEQPNPLNRWKEHCYDYKRDKCKNVPFYRALNKYGEENFKFEVIDTADNPDSLCELEKFYIQKYRSYVHFEDCNGYNCTLGGDGAITRIFNEEEVVQFYLDNDMSIAKTGEHYDCDYRIIKRILDDNKVQTFTSREYIRRKFIEIYGGLVQFDFDCIHVVNIFDCPMDVYKLYPDYKESGLSAAYRLSHKTHHYKGYTWYRLSELPEEYKPLLREYYMNEDNLPIDSTMLDL